jgi:hypothetical protein
LATSIVSNWPTFRPLGKRSLWIPELAVCASYVSDNFQERIERINPDQAGNPIYRFLGDHGFVDFKRGRRSKVEKEDYGETLMNMRSVDKKRL